MEIPSLVAGYRYPSSRCCRCPRFHECTVTHKCQNYDQHLLECQVCESRTNAHEIDSNSVPLGGHLAEGEFYPDLQDAIKELEKMMRKAFAHPDYEGQANPDISNDLSREKKVTDMVSHYLSSGKLTMEEKIYRTIVDPETKHLLGRLE